MLEKTFINHQLGIKFNSFIDEECCVWFKGKQVALILGYKDSDDVIRRLVSKEYKKCLPGKTPGGEIRNYIFIKEEGFYELVFRSKLPTAIQFRKWVFSKVLPSIRKYGFYKTVDLKIKQRVIFDGKKYYKHLVFSNYAASKNGDIINVKNERILKMGKDGSGYLHFKIYDKNLEKPLSYLQHRFVYEVFKGPIPRGFEIDHQNNIKTDNRIKNLQLLTHKQNIEKSKNKPIISINIETGEERRFLSNKKASIELDIKRSLISKICCKRKSYKSATSKKDNQKYTFRYLD